MIRRWSSINNINIIVKQFKKFNKTASLILFRSAVYFKRYKIKRTKFKRKSLARWKHKTNWVLYMNILKYWVRDYVFIRQVTRYQYFKNFFFSTTLSYNTNYIKSQVAKNFSFFSFIFTNAISRRILNYFTFKDFRFKHPFLKNLNYLFVYTSLDNFSQNPDIIPLYLSCDNEYYPISKVENFEISTLYNIFFNILLQKITEIYKILSIFFFLILKS